MNHDSRTAKAGMDTLIADLAIYTRANLPELIALVRKIELNADLIARAAILTSPNTVY